MYATTWRTQTAPAGAVWYVGGYVPAHRTHPYGARSKNVSAARHPHFSPDLCTIPSLTVRFRLFTTALLTQSLECKVWSKADGDQDCPPQYQHDAGNA